MATHTDLYGDPIEVGIDIDRETGERTVCIETEGPANVTPAQAREIAADLIRQAEAAESGLLAIPTT